MLKVTDLLKSNKSEGQPFTSPGKAYTVVSNKKKKTLEETKQEKEAIRRSKAANSVSSTGAELMNAMNPHNSSSKPGADALKLEHGFYKFMNIPEFSYDRV